MYILNTTIEINWLLPATAMPRTYDEFDVIVKRPDGSSSYLESAIAPEDYIAPTVSTTGGVSYPLLFDQKGVWVVILVWGDGASHEIYYEYFLQIHQDDTHIHQQVTSNG
jgi:hypothetical protein